MRRAAPLLIAALFFSPVPFGCGGGSGADTATTTTQASREDDSPEPAGRPAPVEGSKRAAPGVPTSKGGDNSIQAWGVEASEPEREELTAILQAFYDARADADWAKACTYLAADQEAEFAAFVKGKSGNSACAAAMRKLAPEVPQSAFEKEARIGRALSLRVGKGNAFLIYTRPGERKVFANAFADEGGTWKVVSVGPTAIE